MFCLPSVLAVLGCDVMSGSGLSTYMNYSMVQAENLTCLNGTKEFQKTQVPSEQYWT